VVINGWRLEYRVSWWCRKW